MRYSVLLVLVLLFACGDTSNNSGCTDLYAYNYDEFATYDDGSCLYIACADQNAINYGDTIVKYCLEEAHILFAVQFNSWHRYCFSFIISLTAVTRD